MRQISTNDTDGTTKNLQGTNSLNTNTDEQNPHLNNPDSYRPQKIALITIHTSPLDTPGGGNAGGLNVVVQNLATQLADQGLQVDILTRRENPHSPAQISIAPNVNLKILDIGPAKPISRAEISILIPQIKQYANKIDKYQIVHSHYWISGVLGQEIANLQNIPHVLSLHTLAKIKNSNLAADDAPESDLRLRTEEEILATSTLVTVASTAEKQIVMNLGAKQVALTPPGVNPQIFFPLEKEKSHLGSQQICKSDPRVASLSTLPIEATKSSPLPEPPHKNLDLSSNCPLVSSFISSLDGSPFLLLAGRIQPLKGQKIALQALSSVPEPLRPKILFVGDAGAVGNKYFEDLQELVKALDLQNYVCFMPALNQTELSYLMRRAYITIIPSQSETFGMVALESAASGVPVIANDTTGLKESVAENVTGIRIPIENSKAWGELITNLLKDPHLRNSLGRTASAWALAHSWENTAQQTLKAYEKSCALSFPPDRKILETAPTASPSPRNLTIREYSSHKPALSNPKSESLLQNYFPAGPAIVVHAHPDDDLLSGGAILRHIEQTGSLAGLVTATRGEAGELNNIVLKKLGINSISTEELANLRVSERERALHVLGIPSSKCHWLGSGLANARRSQNLTSERKYMDSGMQWGEDGIAQAIPDSAPESLIQASLEEVVKDLRHLVENIGAQSLITYASSGGYGHPDHQIMYQACKLISEQMGISLWCIQEDPLRQAKIPPLPSSLNSHIYKVDALTHRDFLLAGISCYESQIRVLDQNHVLHVGGQTQRLLDTEILLQEIPPDTNNLLQKEFGNNWEEFYKPRFSSSMVTILEPQESKISPNISLSNPSENLFSPHDLALLTGVAPNSIAASVAVEIIRNQVDLIVTASHTSLLRIDFIRQLFDIAQPTTARIWLAQVNLGSYTDIDRFSTWMLESAATSSLTYTPKTSNFSLEINSEGENLCKPDRLPSIVFPFASPSVSGTLIDAGTNFDQHYRILVGGIERLLANLVQARRHLSVSIGASIDKSPNKNLGSDLSINHSKTLDPNHTKLLVRKKFKTKMPAAAPPLFSQDELRDMEDLISEQDPCTELPRLIHFVLPGSPNQGIFGADGAYSEAKSALAVLPRKWRSEPLWRKHVTIAYPLIGWVAGTNLTNHIDSLIPRANKAGITVFSPSQMAVYITNLATIQSRIKAQNAPLEVDISGGISAYISQTGTLGIRNLLRPLRTRF